MLLFLTLSFIFFILYTSSHSSAMKSHIHLFSFLNQIRATLTTLASAIFPNKNPILHPPPQSPPLPPSILHLPDLVLECILQSLPPDALCRMAATCTSLRDMCVADHLWETHLSRKWGRIIKPNSRHDWTLIREEASRKRPSLDRGFVDYLIRLWPIELIRSGFTCTSISAKTNFPPLDSVMSWYLALESGTFWFPAQVFNRENGHVGFMLSCYDAELCYDRRTNTFQARYPPHGRRISAIESFVTWDRLRAPPVDTPPHDLHVSDCLNDLQPGDQIEIQWRRNKEFPYGWWYGIVGHLETCDGNTHYCRCSDNDTVVLEFNQFTRGSRWRTTTVNRKDHREEGNEVGGFYGGIRKLHVDEEILAWEKLWPSQSLE